MKGKIAVGVLVLCGAAGYVGVRGWVAGQPSLPTTFSLEDKGAPEPSAAAKPASGKGPVKPASLRGSVSASRLREVTDDAVVEDLLNRTMEMATLRCRHFLFSGANVLL